MSSTRSRRPPSSTPAPVATPTPKASSKRKASVEDLREVQVTPGRTTAKKSRADLVVSLKVPHAATPVDPGLCEKLLEIVDSVKNVKDASGRLVYKIFHSLPSRHQYPDYYDVISRPIALNVIKGKAEEGEYNSFEEFKADVDLMVNNAKEYNDPKSEVYQDAVRLQALIQKEVSAAKKVLASTPKKPPLKKEAVASEETSASEDVPGISLQDKCISILVELESMKDAQGAPKFAIFRELPSRTLYPDYLRVITSPMTFSMMRSRCTKGGYTSLEDFKADIDLIVSNAKNYNQSKSFAWQLANELKNASAGLIAAASKKSRVHAKTPVKAVKIEETDAVTPKGKERAVQDGETDTPKTPGSGLPEDPHLVKRRAEAVLSAFDEMLDERWSQYSYAPINSSSGEPYFAVFEELPSREDYPDYYKSISKPLALDTVRRRVASGEYQHTKQFKDDIYLIAANARRYNMPESRIYTDAEELKRLMKKTIEIEMRNERERMKGGSAHEACFLAMRTILTFCKALEDDDPPEIVKEKCLQILDDIDDIKDDRGDPYYEAFMTLPSREEFPDYYAIIRHPMALDTIRDKLLTDEYQKTSDFLADIELMVSNARRYNMPTSEIVKSATELQKMVKKAMLKGRSQAARKPATRVSDVKTPRLKLKVTEPTEFQRVPPPTEEDLANAAPLTDEEYDRAFKLLSAANYQKVLELYFSNPHFNYNILRPGSYEGDEFTWGLIHCAARFGRPRGIEIIVARGADVELKDTWHGGTALHYAAFFGHLNIAKLLVDKLHADKFAKNDHDQLPWEFVVNKRDREWIRLLKPPNEPTPEPESEHEDEEAYESHDEMSIGSATRQKKAKGPSTPQKGRRMTWAEQYRYRLLKACITEWLQILMNYRDEGGRQVAKAFIESAFDQDSERVLSINYFLENIRYYGTLKELEEDVLAMFDNARNAGGESSQLRKDADTLQELFLSHRKDIYSKGPKLEKRIMLASEAGLDAEIELLSPTDGLHEHLSFNFQGTEYGVGDYVYVGEDKQIAMIARIWTDPKYDLLDKTMLNADRMIRDPYFVARPFYRPDQIKSLRNSERKLVEKEVFRGSLLKEYRFQDVRGRCHVMFYKDYLYKFPDGFNYNDIYVCVCRFAETAKNQFPHISNWRQAMGIDRVANPVRLIDRPMPIRLRRVNHLGQPIEPVPQFTTPIVESQPRSDEEDVVVDEPNVTNTAKKQRPIQPKAIGQYLQSPEGNMVYYQPTTHDFITPTVGPSGTMELFGKPLTAAKSLLSLPPPLPKGAKLLSAIQVEDADRHQLSIVLNSEPACHSLDVDPNIALLKIHPIAENLQQHYGPHHQPQDLKYYMYQNAVMVPSDPEHPTVFSAKLLPGLNSLEIWVTYTTRTDAVIPITPAPERYSLRGQANSGITQESQQYILFVVKHV